MRYPRKGYGVCAAFFGANYTMIVDKKKDKKTNQKKDTKRKGVGGWYRWMQAVIFPLHREMANL